MKTILAPVDFSPVTRQVVAQAAALGQALAARVILVTVLLEPVFVEEFAPPPRNIARLLTKARRSAGRTLDDLTRDLVARGIHAESRLLEGDPAEQISRVAEETNAACIVIGSHGHTAFYELIVGSTTQRVMRLARCPVLVVPARSRPRRRRRSSGS